MKERITNTKQIDDKYKKLISIVNKNTAEKINKDELIVMINNIYKFTKIIVQKLLDSDIDIVLPLVFKRSKISEYSKAKNKLSEYNKLMKELSEIYVEYKPSFMRYKSLSFDQSVIKLVPSKVDKSTRKNMELLCKDVTQKSSINSKIIDQFSQIPKITTKNVTRKMSKEEKEKEEQKEQQKRKEKERNEIIKNIKDMMNKISKIEKAHSEKDIKNIPGLVTQYLKEDISKYSLKDLNIFKKDLNDMLKKIGK